MSDDFFSQIFNFDLIEFDECTIRIPAQDIPYGASAVVESTPFPCILQVMMIFCLSKLICQYII